MTWAFRIGFGLVLLTLTACGIKGAPEAPDPEADNATTQTRQTDGAVEDDTQ